MQLGLRAVGYRRVSLEQQTDGYSLGAQAAEITRYCQRQGHELVGWFVDEGVSAHTDRIEKRPQLAALLEAAKRREFDIVIVHTLDRWARNVGVQRQALSILGAAGVGFVSVTENFDFTTPAGRMMLTMIGGVSEFFSDQLAVHVSKGQRERVTQGRPIGPVPFGYRARQRGAVPLLEEREAAAVREAFQRRADGATNGQIATWLNEQELATRQGGRFTAHSVRDTFNCRFYIGLVSYRGEEFPGEHEAIISRDVYERVQQRRQSRVRVRPKGGDAKWALQGRVFCARCGRPIHCETASSGKPYYRERHSGACDTVGRAVSATRIDAEVGEYLARLSLDSLWRDRIVEQAMCGDPVDDESAIREQRRRLSRAYAEGAFTDAEYSARLATVDGRLESLRPERLPELELVAALAADVSGLWDRALPHERQQLIAPLIDQVRLDVGAKCVLEVVPTSSFRRLFTPGTRTPGTEDS